jgi:hypothetical protein
VINQPSIETNANLQEGKLDVSSLPNTEKKIVWVIIKSLKASLLLFRNVTFGVHFCLISNTT